jgi:hypothetical protein
VCTEAPVQAVPSDGHPVWGPSLPDSFDDWSWLGPDRRCVGPFEWRRPWGSQEREPTCSGSLGCSATYSDCSCWPEADAPSGADRHSWSALVRARHGPCVARAAAKISTPLVSLGRRARVCSTSCRPPWPICTPAPAMPPVTQSNHNGYHPAVGEGSPRLSAARECRSGTRSVPALEVPADCVAAAPAAIGCAVPGENPAEVDRLTRP